LLRPSRRDSLPHPPQRARPRAHHPTSASSASYIYGDGSERLRALSGPRYVAGALGSVRDKLMKRLESLPPDWFRV